MSGYLYNDAFDNFVWYIGIFYKIVAGMLLIKNKISDMVKECS